MPQEQQKKPPQKPLTPEELARFTDTKFTPSQLQLIWTRKLPVGANLEDLQLFLYSCERRDLDPLLSEAYCRLQFDRDTGEYKLLLLDGYHGLLKSADKTGEMNGIKTTFQEDAVGNLLSATTFVWRKGCEHPFEFTAYWSEFVGLSNGKPSYMWSSKGHVMLGKCSAANALRLAFAAALAGVYVPEELDHSETPEPDADFAVGRLAPDVTSSSPGVVDSDISGRAISPSTASNNPDDALELPARHISGADVSVTSPVSRENIPNYGPSAYLSEPASSSRQRVVIENRNSGIHDKISTDAALDSDTQEADRSIASPTSSLVGSQVPSGPRMPLVDKKKGNSDTSYSDAESQLGNRLGGHSTSLDNTIKGVSYDTEAMLKNQVKSRNQALVQRLMGDLEVNKAIRITVLTDFYRGYLDVEQLPKEPALFTPALEALSAFADANRDARDQFIRSPLALGKRLREESQKHVEAKA